MDAGLHCGKYVLTPIEIFNEDWDRGHDFGYFGGPERAQSSCRAAQGAAGCSLRCIGLGFRVFRLQGSQAL